MPWWWPFKWDEEKPIVGNVMGWTAIPPDKCPQQHKTAGICACIRCPANIVCLAEKDFFNKDCTYRFPTACGAKDRLVGKVIPVDKI